METILIQALKFVGASAASGITWDAIKGAGSRILDGFKKHFANRKYFKDERQAEEFFKDISSKESLNKRQPLEDIWSVYDNCTGSEAADGFKAEFTDWLKRHGDDLRHLGDSFGCGNGIFIQKQVNKENAQVTNIGNQYNYKGF